jgi:hypothetical protein
MFEELFQTMEFTDTSERLKIKILFEEYMKGIPDNFYLNQFELQEKYTGTTYADWYKILTHTPFKTFRDKQVSIIVETSTNKALGGQMDLDKDALNLLKMKKDIVQSESSSQKPIIIVIPESLYFKEEK